MELFAPTLADMIVCARREVRMREGAYPRFVASGKMKQETADRELETMRAIVTMLESLRPLELMGSLATPEFQEIKTYYTKESS